MRRGRARLLVLVGVTAVPVLLAAGCRRQRPPLHPEGPPGYWYVVREGETLADISRRTGTPLDDILELNGIERGEAVAPGRLVYIIESRPPAAGGETERPPPPPVAAGGKAPADQPGRLRWPIENPRVTSPFGIRGSRPHEGIDLGASAGTTVHAAAAGEVVYCGNGIRGYGNLVVIQHDAGLLTVYAHNARLLVRKGDAVSAGQAVATVGQTGRATAPHLHFEVREGQIPRNPMRYLPSSPMPEKTR